MALIRAAQAGNFSNTSTWVGGVVPTTGDIAVSGSFRIVIDSNTGAALSNLNSDWVTAGGSALATNHAGGFTQNSGTYTVGDIYYGRYSSNSTVIITNGTLTTGNIILNSEITGAETSATYYGYAIRINNIATANSTVNLTTGTLTIRGVNSVATMIGSAIGWAPSGSNVTNLSLGEVILDTGDCAWMRAFYRYLGGLGSVNFILNGKVPVPTYNSASAATFEISTGQGSLGNITLNSEIVTYGTGKQITASCCFYVGNSLSTSAISSVGNITTNHSNGSFFYPYSIGSGQVKSFTCNGNMTINNSGIFATNSSMTGGTGTSFTINGDLTVNINSDLSSNAIFQVNAKTISITGNVTVNASAGATYNGVVFRSNSPDTPNHILTIGQNLVFNGGQQSSFFDWQAANPHSVSITGNIDLTTMTGTSPLSKGLFTYAASVTSANSFSFQDMLFPLDLASNTETKPQVSTPIMGVSSTFSNFSITCRDIVCGNSKFSLISQNAAASTITITARDIYMADSLLAFSASTVTTGTCYAYIRGLRVRSGATNVQLPIQGWRVRFTQDDNFVEMLEQNTGATLTFSDVTGFSIPLPEDVRDGVAVGVDVGTLVVPQASNVLSGTIFDNGTTGTLSTSGSTNLTPVLNAIQAVQDVVDKIEFQTVYDNPDQFYTSNVFVAEMNGANGQTTYTSESGHAWTATGSPALSNSFFRTGATSLLISSSIASFGDIASTNLGASDFTIEFSFRAVTVPSTVGQFAGILGKRNSGADFAWIIYLNESKLTFLTDGTSPISLSHTSTISANTWYDVVISRTDNIIKMYINGTLYQAACTGLSINTSTTAPLYIGRLNYASAGSDYDGYIDRIRITSGVGRYNTTAPTSPPTTLYPTSTLGTALYDAVIAQCSDGNTTTATTLDISLEDLKNRINAVHFIVKEE